MRITIDDFFSQFIHVLDARTNARISSVQAVDTMLGVVEIDGTEYSLDNYLVLLDIVALEAHIERAREHSLALRQLVLPLDFG